ncbi:MAG: MBL fold metallo-hydrolase [Anaerovibrio sp.]|nr:MBL fold metallo-hydrolase [Anaerovibrio sp.]
MFRKVYQGLFVLALLFTLLLSGCGQVAGNTEKSNNNFIEEQLTIKAIDVGQGDAYLIKTGAQVILIDTGDDKYRDGAKKGENNNRLFEALDNEGVTHINKLILTHAHADHIGCAAKVMKKYKVDELIYNGIPSTSSPFRNALKAANGASVTKITVQAGEVLDFGKGVLFEVLSPSAELIARDTRGISNNEKVNVNNESIVGKLTFGDFSMLFTGDAEKDIEKDLLAIYGKEKLACKVYKVAHHGSRSSSSAKYVKAINPEWAIISCGQEKTYGHPHKEPMKLFGDMCVNVMETDLNGTITIVSDGKTYSVTGER